MLKFWNFNDTQNFYVDWIDSLSLNDFIDYCDNRSEVCTVGYRPL